MSPVFLNRFVFIILEDQLKYIFNLTNSKNEFLNLIDTMVKQHSFNYQSKKEKNVTENDSSKNDDKNQDKKAGKKKNKNKNVNLNKFLGDTSDIKIKNRKKNFEFNYKKR